LPENGAAPLSPRTAMPRVLERERDALLVEIIKSDSLSQVVFDMGNFIDKMGSAIATECAKAGKPEKAQRMREMAAQISNALGQVDTHFDRTDFAQCKTYVLAAKSNQVSLLAAIDGLKQDPDGDQVFSGVHDHCLQLGQKITALLQIVNERLHQQEEQQQQRQQQQQQPRSPRPSAPRYAQSPERQKNQKTKKTDAVFTQSLTEQRTPRSPDRESGRGRLEKMPSPPSGKRAQGDEDSPQFKNSPAKRHKAEATEKTVSSPSRKPGDAMTPSSVPAETRSGMAPGSATTVPKLDWSKAKPASTGPHSPISTTPRTSRHARTEGKGNEQQEASTTVTSSPAPAPAHDPRAVTSGDDHTCSPPTSPTSARSGFKQDSPRKALSSPSKPLRPQPKPRPPSMLFLSPPGPSSTADQTEKVSDGDSGDDSDVKALKRPPSTPGVTSTISTATTTTTTTTTDAGPSTREQADA
jgi:hypothetical protein